MNAPRFVNPRGTPQKASPRAGSGGPSPGSYPPVLDAEAEKSKSGLAQNLASYRTQLGRGSSAYLIGTGQTTHAYEEAKRNAEQQHAQNLQDLATERQYAQENHDTATQALGRSYTQLGQTQAQHAEQTGNGDGGALAAALIRRGENEGIQQQGLDTALSRSLAAAGTREGRLNQAYGETMGTPTSEGSLAYNLAQQQGKLGLQHEYSDADISTKELNDIRNEQEYQRQNGAEKSYVASQMTKAGEVA